MLVVVDPVLQPIVQRFAIISVSKVVYRFTDTVAGYGFVDFDTEQAAELAMKALKAEGRQAQMARVGYFLLCHCSKL